MSVTITQQQGFFYLSIGGYLLEIFSDVLRADKRKKEIEDILR